MEYKKKYKEAQKWIESIYSELSHEQQMEAEAFFPELKESDDERVRKEIIETFKKLGDGKIPVDINYADIFTWLEKQGEQKVPVVDFKAKDWYVSKLDGKIHNIYNSVDKVEPKFHEGDIIQFNGFGHNRYTIKNVCGLSHYINTIGEKMDMSYTDANFEVIKDSDKNKLCRAWSEEDDYNVQCLVAKANCDIQKGNVGRNEELIDWLKSLKDRYTWKPSDEQIEVLESIRKILHADKDIYSKANNLMYNFEELIRTLKKLREE